MRIKWYFWNEPPSDFSNIPAFALKSAWKPPKGHPNLEVFLSQVKSDNHACEISTFNTVS